MTQVPRAFASIIVAIVWTPECHRESRKTVAFFVQSEACLPCSLYDGEPMKHRAVVAPLTTDPLSGKKYPNPFVITDRGRSESKLSSDFGDS